MTIQQTMELMGSATTQKEAAAMQELLRERGLDADTLSDAEFFALIPEIRMTTYEYSVEMSINAGEALITVDATDGETKAGAMFIVNSDGDLTCDTTSDACEANPFDEAWPEPPAKYITEAQKLAAATVSDEDE